MVLLADRVLEQTIARGLARSCELVGFARDPALALPAADREGIARRRGGALASPDGPRLAGPPGRLGAVELVARRLARPPANLRDRPRGDRRDRRPGEVDAGDPAGRAVEGRGPLWERGAV